jgi:precorrin-3B synthase
MPGSGVDPIARYPTGSAVQSAGPVSRGREDRCPGAIDLHEALDGWVARIRLPGGRITTDQLAGLAAVSRIGSGIVDLTSRGNVQLRGLRQQSESRLVPALADLGLMPSPDHDRVRNILADPLSGRRPGALADTDAAVRALDKAICGDPVLTGLPSRFLFGVGDGAGPLARRADIEIRVVRATGLLFGLRIGGHATDVYAEGAEGAAVMGVEAAAAFLGVVGSSSEAWRVRDVDGCAEAMATALGGTLSREEFELGSAGRLEPGIAAQRDSLAAVTAVVPLGRLDVDQATALAGAAAGRGGDLRVSCDRTITVVDVPPVVASELAAELSDLDLVAAPGSGWSGLSACVGHPGCGRSLVDLREAVRQRGSERAAGDPREHWSGCERRCGTPTDVELAVTAVPSGALVDGEDSVLTTAVSRLEWVGH